MKQSINSVFSYNFRSVAFFGFYAYFAMKKAISKLL